MSSSDVMTGARAIAEVIARQPNPTVYGMPGGHTILIFDALQALGDAVKVHLVRQESVGTVMAEVQGRLTGSPAFVIGQGSWVLGNAGIGIMEAHLGASPVVVLVDATDGGYFSHHGPYQTGIGGYGAYDLRAALQAITKRTFFALDPTQALQMTQLAVKHAMTGEPGPVAVVFHSRALFGSIDPRLQPPIYLDRSYVVADRQLPSMEAVERAVDLIRASRRPVVVAGNGVRVSKAQSALVEFAETTGIPVATTVGGKGTFPERHELALGVIGTFGHGTANEVVGGSDLILAVGTKLGSTDTCGQHPRLVDLNRQEIVHVDVEPLNVSWTLPAREALIGDAARTLTVFREQLGGFHTDGRKRVLSARSKHTYFDEPFTSQPGELDGRDAIRLLSQELPDRVIVGCDAGENRLFVLRDFQSRYGGTVLQPSGGGGMGYAIPAAMSAALNAPDCKSVAVCGDGGYSLSLHSLMSAVELGLRMVVLVLDNGLLGWVYNGQRGRYIASELRDFDYAAIARSMGACAATVSTVDELRAELRNALDHPGVFVIVAKTTNRDRYQHIMSDLNPGDVYSVPELQTAGGRE